MAKLRTSLIRNPAQCKKCGHAFVVYSFPDFEYGRRLGRTPDPLELGVINCIEDEVCQEVGEFVDNLLTPGSKEEWEQAECFDTVLGIACDPSPSGYEYDFTGKIHCPVCTAWDVRYGPEQPPQTEKIALHLITHEAWEKLSRREKRNLVREALHNTSCLD